MKDDFPSERPESLGYILDEAKRIINGQRQTDYGKPEDSFKAIAGYWNWYLRNRLQSNQIDYDSHTGKKHGNNITAHDVAVMMVLFKIAREEHSHKQDNLIDACGYLAILDKMIRQE